MNQGHTRAWDWPRLWSFCESLPFGNFWDRSEYIFTRIWSVTHVSMDLSSDCFIKMQVWSIVNICRRPLGRHHNVRTPLELGEVICPQKHPQITSGKAVRPLRPTEGVGRRGNCGEFQDVSVLSFHWFHLYKWYVRCWDQFRSICRYVNLRDGVFPFEISSLKGRCQKHPFSNWRYTGASPVSEALIKMMAEEDPQIGNGPKSPPFRAKNPTDY